MIERVLDLVFEWLKFDNAIVELDRGVFSFDLWRKFLSSSDSNLKMSCRSDSYS